MLKGGGLVQVKNNIQTKYYQNAYFICESVHCPKDKHCDVIERGTEFIELDDKYDATQ